MTTTEIVAHIGAEGGHLARPLARRPVMLNYGFSGEAEDEKACSAAIRRGSKSFHVASLMLDEVTVISAEPNRFEVGPHPDKIEF